MDKITYEEAMKRLEEIVKKLENNQVSLDESIDLFEEGIQLTKICNQKIKSIENKVAKILVDGELKDIEVDDHNG